MTRLVLRYGTALSIAATLLLTCRLSAAQEGAEGERPWGPPPPGAEEGGVETAGAPEPATAAEPAPGEVVAPPPAPAEEPTAVAVPAPAPVPDPDPDADPMPADEPASAASQPAPAGGEASGPVAAGPVSEDGTFPVRLGGLVLQPFVIIVGGFNYHHVVQNDIEGLDDQRQGRFTAVAMTRFGFQGHIGEHVSLRSELELNAGPHGTSVWEGQAAMSVLDQYVRITFGGFHLDAGRITDPASIDYFSSHVANMLLTDDWVRTPFLYSGANRGNGVMARYELIQGLRLGLTVNAGNPLSNTGSAMFGGTYGIFTRFYTQAQSSVSDSPSTFPDDKFYVLLISPSLTYEWDYLRAQFSFQWMMMDPNMSDDENHAAEAMNFRGGLQGLFWDRRLRPFFNFSHVANHTFDTRGTTPVIDHLSDSIFEGITLGGGIDVDFIGNTGFGIQYNWVSEQQGDYNTITTRHYLNIGGSWWFLPSVCVEARYAYYLQCQNVGDGPECGAQQHHNIFLTLRGVFGLEPTRRAAQTL